MAASCNSVNLLSLDVQQFWIERFSKIICYCEPCRGAPTIVKYFPTARREVGNISLSSALRGRARQSLVIFENRFNQKMLNIEYSQLTTLEFREQSYAHFPARYRAKKTRDEAQQ